MRLNAPIRCLAAAAAVLALIAGPAGAKPRPRHHHVHQAPARVYARPSPAPAPPAPTAPDAARKALYAHLDKVLQAMMDHDPAAAGLAPDARYTENGQAMAPGQGLWRTASAIAIEGDGLSSLGVSSPAYRLYFADVANDEAGYLGSVTEGGKPGVLVLRIKVVGGRTAEVEAVVAREGATGAVALNPKAFQTPDPSLLATDGTLPRSALAAAANRYFEAMRGQPGADPALSPACIRRENGQAFGCAPQPVSAIRDGRVMAADVDRGLVLIGAMLDRSFAGQASSTELAAMLFKLKGGQIARIEGLSVPVAPGARGGWSP